MEEYELILGAIYDAIRDVNELDPDNPLEQSPDTVLLGQGATLDSLGVVTLAVATDEGIDRALDKTISVMDVLMASEEDSVRVSDLANRIAKRIGCAIPA